MIDKVGSVADWLQAASTLFVALAAGASCATVWRVARDADTAARQRHDGELKAIHETVSQLMMAITKKQLDQAMTLW